MEERYRRHSTIITTNLAYDEWRAQVKCKRGLGQFQLTWNVKPMQSQIIIHGTRAVLRVDLFAMFQGKRPARSSYVGARQSETPCRKRS